MAPKMKRYKVHYRAGSNIGFIIVQAQTRWDVRGRAKVMLPSGAKIIGVEEI
jgi:hypothetical protein